MVDLEQPDVRRLTNIGGGRANTFAVEIPENPGIADKCVREIAQSAGSPSPCVIIAALNQTAGEFVIPRDEQVIRAGDELFLISTAPGITAAANVIRGQPGR